MIWLLLNRIFHKREIYVLIVICFGLFISVAILLLILYKKTRQLITNYFHHFIKLVTDGR
jgi:hypothetical protein